MPKKRITTHVKLHHLPYHIFTATPDGRGKFEPSFIDSILLKALSVITEKIAENAVTTGKIEDLAVTNAKIDNLAVTVAKIADLAVETAKIANLAVTNAKIDNLAVTTGKIEDLAVQTGKIDDLAVTTAKIEDLACTTGKINDLAVTNLKLGNASVSLPKVTARARWEVYTDHQSIIHTFGGTAYYETVGRYFFRKNELLLAIDNVNYSRVAGYPIIEKTFNPEFKARVHYNNISALDVQARVGLGYYTTPFAFSINEQLAMSLRNWTINTKTHKHLGLLELGSETDVSLPYSSLKRILVSTLKVSPTGDETVIGSGAIYDITETSKTLVNFTLSFPSSATIPEGYALKLMVALNNGAEITYTYFITSPMKELIIPSGTPITIYLWVYDDGANIHWYYGNSGAGISNRSRFRADFPVIYFINELVNTKAAYPCKTFSAGDKVVLHARYEHSTTKSMWRINGTNEETWLGEDDYFEPYSPIRDGLFVLSANETGTEELYIFNFTAQEEWMI